MTDFNTPDDFDDQDLPPSKSQLKREMQHLQTLGEKLMNLTDAQLSTVPLTDKLADALKEAKRIKSHEGLRRHKQYIGKVIREADTDAIEERIRAFESAHQLNTRQFQELETLRDQLIEGDNAIIGDVIGRFSGVDTQKLRQLVRNCRKERDHNLAHPERPEKAHSRKLFRYLRELSEAQ